MSDEKTHPDQPSNLRLQAEEKARAEAPQMPDNLGTLALEQPERLLHELRVHQIELEMQNDELRGALAMQEAIFQGSRDAVFISDPESRFVAVNTAACELTGYSVEELLSMRIPDLHERVDLHAYDAYHDSIMAGAEVLSEAPILRKDGRKVDTEFNSRAVVVDGKAVMHTTARDITTRKWAEEAFKESEARYRDLVENASDLICTHDLKGVLLSVNAAAARTLGFATEEIVGRSLRDLLPGDRQNELDAYLAAIVRDGVARGVLNVVIRPGDVRYWEYRNSLRTGGAGAPVVRGVARDVTEQVLAKRALKRSEEKYRTVLETIEESYYEVDVAGNLTFFNDSLCRLLGYSRDELTGMNDRQYTDAENATKLYQAFNAVYRTGEPTRGIDWEIIRKDGTKRIIEASVSLRNDAAGKPVGFRGIIRDITERKQVEEALEHSRAQLLQAQKMEAVGRLAGGVAHDFNNILQAMLSLATVLRIKSGSPELARIVAEIEALIKRGAGLTQQLLLYSRRQVAEKKRVDLGELAGTVGVLLRRLIPENIRLTVEATPERSWVDGDAGQLQQVLMNLVVNAKDAMPSGGTLTVRTASVGGEAVLEVIDTGHGMDEETRIHLFEPFFTTKGVGTGLGLSVVHGIVEQHGGRVEVESVPGEGSLFRVILPAIPAPDEAADEPSDETEVPHGYGERVLIVEDEDGARQGLTELLTILGYTVTAVGSGEEAGLLPAEPAPDLLLTDLMLPGIDGAALAAGLRDRWPGLKVVLMSGYTEDQAVRRGVNEGEVRFLQKPFDMAAVARTLRAALD